MQIPEAACDKAKIETCGSGREMLRCTRFGTGIMPNGKACADCHRNKAGQTKPLYRDHVAASIAAWGGRSGVEAVRILTAHVVADDADTKIDWSEILVSLTKSGTLTAEEAVQLAGELGICVEAPSEPA